MLKGLKLSETFPYISIYDDARVVSEETGLVDVKASEENGATVWLLGNFTADDRAVVGDQAMDFTQTESGIKLKMQNSTRNLEAVRRGLRGWRNFKDDTGENDVPYKTARITSNNRKKDVVSDESLNWIPTQVINELGEELLTKNALNIDLKKKSSIPPSLLSALSTLIADDVETPIKSDGAAQPIAK